MNQETTQPISKKRALSCIQPSGTFTLGNYLGALKNWVKMEKSGEYDCLYAVADLHAITVRQEPAALRRQIIDAYAMLLALGLDPQESIIFIQSHVAAHSQLAWLLNCYTQFGEMSRMTQFKDKSAKHADNVNVGLFSYPVLMAADILLYQPDIVPVGQDQKQHVEICRDIASRFNNIYGDVFKMPEPYIPPQGARVMSLQDPTKKMSKSDENVNSFISVLDKPEDIIRKVNRAVTDSEARVCIGENKAGINNLMGIHSVITGKSFDDITAEFEGKGYGEFKKAVGEAIVEELRPIRENYERIVKDKAYLESLYKNGAEKAERIAYRTLGKAMKKIGFIAR